MMMLPSVIEEAVKVLGDELVSHPERKAAYRDVKRMAHNERISIDRIAA